MEYMLLIYTDDSIERTPEEHAEIDRAVRAWDKEMFERGVLKQAQRLAVASDATTVRVRDEEFLISDGPFAEAKEQLAGFCVIDVADLDEALELVRTDPIARIGSIEVRPLWQE
jgi:hypothetical protein